MPILTLLPLIFAALKVVMEIISYLQAHPEVEAEAKEYLGKASTALSLAHGYVSQLDPKANNIESP